MATLQKYSLHINDDINGEKNKITKQLDPRASFTNMV